MTDKDAKAAEFYEDARNREASGPPVRRKVDRRLTNHVPVRFTGAMINEVKELAEKDGATVSSWIRNLVEREVRRRKHTIRTGGTNLPRFEWHVIPLPADVTPAVSTSVPNEEPESDIQSAMA